MAHESIGKIAAGLAAQATEGWTATHGAGAYYFGDLIDEARMKLELNAVHAFAHFERTEGDVHAVVTLNVTELSDAAGKYEREHAFGGRQVEGDTLVNGGCFTRRGIDCASVWLQSTATAEDARSNVYSNVADMLAGEWTRCCNSVERTKTAEPVPGTPFTRQPEWFAKAAADLRAGKSVSLSPHGFGTGYTITRRKQRFDTRASAALETRLGVAPLFLGTFDAD